MNLGYYRLELLRLPRYAEGNLKQAELEYPDFITFLPNRPEVAEAQLKNRLYPKQKQKSRVGITADFSWLQNVRGVTQAAPFNTLPTRQLPSFINAFVGCAVVRKELSFLPGKSVASTMTSSGCRGARYKEQFNESFSVVHYWTRHVSVSVAVAGHVGRSSAELGKVVAMVDAVAEQAAAAMGPASAEGAKDRQNNQV